MAEDNHKKVEANEKLLDHINYSDMKYDAKTLS